MWRNGRSRRWLVGGVAVVGVFAGPPAANAVFQVFTASGVITWITPSSELHTVLEVGDPFVAIAVYDNASLDGTGTGNITLDPNVNPGHSLDLTVGSAAVFTFDETDDLEFGRGTFPEIQFTGGSFSGFDLIGQFSLNGIDFDIDLGYDLIIERSLLNQDNVLELAGEILEISQKPVSPD